jgi:hypothetical protein
MTTGTASVVLESSAVVSQEDGSLLDPGDKVQVAVDRATGVVRYSMLRDGTPRLVAEGRLPSAPRAATSTSLSSMGLVVGVIPEAATDSALLWTGDTTESSQSTAPLPGTGYQAFAVWHAPTAARDTFAGVDWTDGTAVFRDDGSSVRSAKDGDLVAFVDVDRDLFGMFGDGSTGTKRLSDVDRSPAALPAMMLGRQNDGSSTMVNAVLVVLPAGAHDVVATPKTSAKVTATRTFAGTSSTDPTLVIVRLTFPLSVTDTGIERVAWTRADGSSASSDVGF